MGKLGKNARKFAKKNLQSVMKRKRKINSVFKKRAAKKGGRGGGNHKEEIIQQTSGRETQVEDVGAISFDAIFNENDTDMGGDDSGSDGYLSEDAGCIDIDEGKREINLKDSSKDTAVSGQNRNVFTELAKQKEKLERLKERNPEFVKFLESTKGRTVPITEEENNSGEDESDDDDMQSTDEDGALLGNQYSGEDESDDDDSQSTDEDGALLGNQYLGEDESDNDDSQSTDEDGALLRVGKFLSSSAVGSLCQLVKEQHDVPSLVRILNAYRAGSHYGSESFGVLRGTESLGNIMIFVLQEANEVFRKILGISSSTQKKEVILELKNTSKWKTLRPLIKLYLRSTIFLLNEVTDSEILAFILKRLRTSVAFFAAFPSLLQRLIKISVHIWATGKGDLSVQSFLVIQDVAVVFNSDLFDTCFVKAYKTIIGHCKFVDPAIFEHLQFLKKSFIELCSQDMQKSMRMAILSIRELARSLQLGLRTRQKDVVKKICSWQYVNCIDLWIINGVAVLFPGPRYLPLRVKSVQWLNLLSSSCSTFIPVASLVLDILEYRVDKEHQKPGKIFDLSSEVKLPKHWMKSRNFQEACVFSTLELLAVHFAQWGCHISFPELATIPLIHLRKFHERTTIESFRRMVKRFIDQVEQNVELVRKKRDEVAFSPKDEEAAASFLQLEKSGGNLPFIQYYKSLTGRVTSRDLLMSKNLSSLEPKKAKGKKQRPSKELKPMEE
ncbi:Protein REBELOTE [Linum grandiflorum]